MPAFYPPPATSPFLPSQKPAWYETAPTEGSLDMLARLQKQNPLLAARFLEVLRRRKQKLQTQTVNPRQAPLSPLEDVQTHWKY